MSDNTVSWPSELELRPLERPPDVTVRVPGSKSLTNRALVLAALASRVGPCTLTNPLHGEDTEVMVAALRQLGYAVRPTGDRGRRHDRPPLRADRAGVVGRSVPGKFGHVDAVSHRPDGLGTWDVSARRHRPDA